MPLTPKQLVAAAPVMTDNQQDNQQQGGQDYSDMFRDFYNYYFGQSGR